MATKGERIRAIMAEERQTTMRRVEGEPHADDIMGIWLATQDAINAYVQREDRTLPVAVTLAALRVQADEIERINARLVVEGLAPEVR